MKANRLIDHLFDITLGLKAVDGVLEILGGLILAFARPSTIQTFAHIVTQHELSTDPSDFIATHIVRSATTIGQSGATFAALYLLSHGLIKVALVVAVLKRKLWAYPLMIGFLVVFIIYQLYRLTHHPTVGLGLLTAFDVFMVWLTNVEYHKQIAIENNS